MNIDYKIILLLVASIGCFNFQITAALFKKKLDPEWANIILRGDIDTLKTLIEQFGKNIIQARTRYCDQYRLGIDETPLIVAAKGNQEAIVKLLLEYPDTEINARDYYGADALTSAAARGYTNIIKLLLQAPDIDINSSSYQGNTALIHAATTDEKTVAALLEAPTIDVNCQNNYGTTPLMCATASKKEKIVKLLLKAPGIDVNMKAKSGSTTLIWATAHNHKNIVKLLLDAPDIDIFVQNRWGNTCLTIAKEKKFVQIEELINKKICELTQVAFKAIDDLDIETLRKLIKQIKVETAANQEGDTLAHAAFTKNSPEAIGAILLAAKDPRELLLAQNKKGQLPLELINPTTPIFNLFLDIAFAPSFKTRVYSFITELLNLDKNRCGHCNKKNCSARCAQCKKVYYCSQDCQKAHWPAHKDICKITL